MLKKSLFENYINYIQVWGVCFRSAPYTKINFTNDIYHRLNLNTNFDLSQYGFSMINMFEPNKIIDNSLFTMNTIDVDHVSLDNIDLSINHLNLTIDQVTVINNQLILLTQQKNPIENGVYIYNGINLTRSILVNDYNTYNLSVRKKIDTFSFEYWYLLHNSIKVDNQDYDIDPRTIPPFSTSNNEKNLNDYFYFVYIFPSINQPLFFKKGNNNLMRSDFEYMIFDENYSFNDLYFVKNESILEKVWIVGDFGTILKLEPDTQKPYYYSITTINTVNVSPKFIKIEVQDKSNFNKILFMNNIGFICGENGSILRTSDEGASWKVLDSTSNENLLAMDFTNPNFGVVVGTNGTILTTNDSGQNWIQTFVPIEFSKNFKACKIFTYGIGSIGMLLGGDNGIVLRLKYNQGHWSFISNNIAPSLDLQNLKYPTGNIIKIESTGYTDKKVYENEDEKYESWLISTDKEIFVYFLNTNVVSKLEEFIIPLTIYDDGSVEILHNYTSSSVEIYWDEIYLKWHIYISTLEDEINPVTIFKLTIPGYYLNENNEIIKGFNYKSLLEKYYVDRVFVTQDKNTLQFKSFKIFEDFDQDTIFTVGPNKYIGISSGISKNPAKFGYNNINQYITAPLRWQNVDGYTYLFNMTKRNLKDPIDLAFGDYSHNNFAHLNLSSSTTILDYTNTSIDNKVNFVNNYRNKVITCLESNLIGTWGNGILEYDSINNTLSSFLNEPKYIRFLYKDLPITDRLWILTPDGVFIKTSTDIYEITINNNSIKNGNSISEIVVDGTNSIGFIISTINKCYVLNSIHVDVNDANNNILNLTIDENIELIESTSQVIDLSYLSNNYSSINVHNNPNVKYIIISTYDNGSWIIETSKIFNNYFKSFSDFRVIKKVITNKIIVSNRIRNIKVLDVEDVSYFYILTEGDGLFIKNGLLGSSYERLHNMTRDSGSPSYQISNNKIYDLVLPTNTTNKIAISCDYGEISYVDLKSVDNLYFGFTRKSYSENIIEFPIGISREGWIEKMDITVIENIFIPRLIFLDYFIGKKIQYIKKAKALLKLVWNKDMTPTLTMKPIEEGEGLYFNTWDAKWNPNFLTTFSSIQYPWTNMTSYATDRRFKILYSNVSSKLLNYNNWNLYDYSVRDFNNELAAVKYLPKDFSLDNAGNQILDPSGNAPIWYKNRLMVCAYGTNPDNVLGYVDGRTIRMYMFKDSTDNDPLFYSKIGDMIWIKIDRDNRFDNNIFESTEIKTDDTTTLYSSFNYIVNFRVENNEWTDNGWRVIDLLWSLPDEIVRFINDYKLPIKVQILNVSRFGNDNIEDNESQGIVLGLKTALDLHPILNQIYQSTIIKRPYLSNEDYLLLESKEINAYFNLASKLEIISTGGFNIANYNDEARRFQFSDKLEISDEIDLLYQINTIYGTNYDLLSFMSRIKDVNDDTIFTADYLFRNEHVNNIWTTLNDFSGSSRILPNIYNLKYNNPSNTDNDFTLNENSIIFNVKETSGKGLDSRQYDSVILGTFLLVKRVSDGLFLNQVGLVKTKSIVEWQGVKYYKFDLDVFQSPWWQNDTNTHIIFDNNNTDLIYNIDSFKPTYINDIPTKVFGILDNVEWWLEEEYHFIWDLTLGQISQLLNYSDDFLLKTPKIVTDGYARVLSNDYNVRQYFTGMYFTDLNNDICLSLFKNWEKDPSLLYKPSELTYLDEGISYIVKYGEYNKVLDFKNKYYNLKTASFKKIINLNEDLQIVWVDNIVLVYQISKDLYWEMETMIENWSFEGTILDIELVKISSKKNIILISSTSGLYTYQVSYENEMLFSTEDGLSIFKETWTNYSNDRIDTSNLIINSSVKDVKGDYWVATNNGLFNLTLDSHYYTGININILHLDNYTGSLWIGSNIGLKLYDYTFFYNFGSFNNLITSINSSNDTLYFGSNSQLVEVDLISLDIINNILNINTYNSPILGQDIKNIQINSKNDVYLTIQNTLFKLDGIITDIISKYNTIAKFRYNNDILTSITSNITCSYIDTFDRLWLGTDNGLYMWPTYNFDSNDNVNHGYYYGYYYNDVQSTVLIEVDNSEIISNNLPFSANNGDIFEDSNGVIWKFDNKWKKIYGLYENYITNIFENSSSHLVISIKDKGYLIWDMTDIYLGKLNWTIHNILSTEINLGMNDGLLSNSINNIFILENKDIVLFKPYKPYKSSTYPYLDSLSNAAFDNGITEKEYINYLWSRISNGKLNLNSLNESDVSTRSVNKLKMTKSFSTIIKQQNSIVWIGVKTNSNLQELWYLNVGLLWESYPHITEFAIRPELNQKLFNSFTQNLNEDPLYYDKKLKLLGYYEIPDNIWVNKTRLSRLEWRNVNGDSNMFAYLSDLSSNINDKNYIMTFDKFIGNSSSQRYEIVSMHAIESGDINVDNILKSYYVQDSTRPTNFSDNYQLDPTFNYYDTLDAADKALNIINGNFNTDLFGLDPNILTHINENLITDKIDYPINPSIVERDVRKNIIILSIVVKAGSKYKILLTTYDYTNEELPYNTPISTLNPYSEKNKMLGKFFWSTEDTTEELFSINSANIDKSIHFKNVKDSLEQQTFLGGDIKDITLYPSTDEHNWELAIGSTGLNSGLSILNFNLFNSIIQIRDKDIKLFNNTTNQLFSDQIYKLIPDISNNMELLIVDSWGLEAWDLKSNFIKQKFYSPNLLDYISLNNSIVLLSRNSLLVNNGNTVWEILTDKLSKSYTLVNGLNFAKLNRDYSWILNASIEESYIGVIPDPDTGVEKLIWYDGRWKCGVWLDGIWCQGTWHNGTWMDGKWGTWKTTKSGDKSYDVNFKTLQNEINQKLSIWLNGRWIFGTWNNGIWYYGCWTDGEHLNGKWLNGIWSNGIWRNGDFLGGDWCEGRFYNGLINEEFAKITWHDGLLLGGDFGSGVWISGTFDQLNTNIKSRFGTKSNKKTPAIWRTGTWVNGEMWGGIELDQNVSNEWTIWYSGLWKNGSHYGGTWYLGTWENGTWYDGVWIGYVEVDKENDLLKIDVKNAYSNNADFSPFNSYPYESRPDLKTEEGRFMRCFFKNNIYIQPNLEFWIGGDITYKYSELNANTKSNNIYNWKPTKLYKSIKYLNNGFPNIDHTTNDYIITEDSSIEESVVEYYGEIYLLRKNSNTSATYPYNDINGPQNPKEDVSMNPEGSVWSPLILKLGYNGKPKKHNVENYYNYDQLITYNGNKKGLINPYTGVKELVTNYNMCDIDKNKDSWSNNQRVFSAIVHVQRIYNTMYIMSEWKGGTWKGGIFINGVFNGGIWENGLFINGTILKGEFKS